MEIRQYIAIGLRWWWLIVLLTLMAATATYLFTVRQATIYQASTTILVGRTIQAIDVNAGDFNTTARLAETYADMALRQPILEEVVTALNLNRSWKALRGQLSVRPVNNTQLLQITATASTPEEAQAVADEVAHQLILLSPTAMQNEEQNETQRLIRQRYESLQTKIEAGQERVKALEEEIATSLSVQRVKELQNEINTLEGLIATWENTVTQLLIFADSKKSPNYLTVIEAAQVSSHQPETLTMTLTGSAVGFSLALGLIFLFEYLDESLKSAEDLRQRLGLTVLGIVGRIKGRQPQDRLIVAAHQFSQTAEIYRMVRTNIQFISVGKSVKSILVSSATPGEGKSTTVANLGVVMAQAGFRTILVDTDLRQPILHQIFQLSNTEGLTQLLHSPQPDLKRYLRSTPVKNLEIITSGALPANPSELLGSRRMEQLLNALNKLADFVIYDSPPVLVVTDAAVLAGRVDGTIVVVKAGHTRLGEARQAISTLAQVEAHLLGGILNQATSRGWGYKSHYYPDNRSGHDAFGQSLTPGHQGTGVGWPPHKPRSGKSIFSEQNSTKG